MLRNSEVQLLPYATALPIVRQKLNFWVRESATLRDSEVQLLPHATALPIVRQKLNFSARETTSPHQRLIDPFRNLNILHRHTGQISDRNLLIIVTAGTIPRNHIPQLA